MKELRIFLAVISLLLLAGFTSSALARESESDDDHKSTGTYMSHDDDDDDDDDDRRDNLKERLKKLREINAERIKKLREKRKSHHYIHSGSTLTGSTTQTGSTKLPVTPVKPPVTPAPTTPTTPAAPVAVTRSATVTYRTPATSSDPVGFSVTVKNGVITAASATVKSQDKTSIGYQKSFANSISAQAVGKKAAGLNLSAVGGASLTTTAFEKFVAANF